MLNTACGSGGWGFTVLHGASNALVVLSPRSDIREFLTSPLLGIVAGTKSLRLRLTFTQFKRAFGSVLNSVLVVMRRTQALCLDSTRATLLCARYLFSLRKRFGEPPPAHVLVMTVATPSAVNDARTAINRTVFLVLMPVRPDGG